MDLKEQVKERIREAAKRVRKVMKPEISNLQEQRQYQERRPAKYSDRKPSVPGKRLLIYGSYK